MRVRGGKNLTARALKLFYIVYSVYRITSLYFKGFL